MVRAKFLVKKVEVTTPRSANASAGFAIEMQPVYDTNPNSENGQFYKWTPGGKIELSTINEEAAAQLKVGEEVYVDFTPVTNPPGSR